MKIASNANSHRSYFKLVSEAAKSKGFSKDDIESALVVLGIERNGSNVMMLLKSVNDFNSIAKLIHNGVIGGNVELSVTVKDTAVDGDDAKLFWESLDMVEDSVTEYMVVPNANWKA